MLHKLARRLRPGRGPRLGRGSALGVSLLFLPVGGTMACGDEPVVQPTFELTEMYGDYELETLTFDPRGSLPLVDVESRLEFTEPPELVVAEGGQAQLLYREGTGLRQIVSGSWQLLSEEQIRLTLGDGTTAGRLLIPRTLELVVNVGVGRLSFNGAIESGLSRANVLRIFPEWEQEQLLDPVPGDLVVSFRKSS